MTKNESKPRKLEKVYAPGADACPAFEVCWELGTSRPYCADISAHSVNTGKGSKESKMLIKIEDQLDNMETCLHSMVLLMSELNKKVSIGSQTGLEKQS